MPHWVFEGNCALGSHKMLSVTYSWGSFQQTSSKKFWKLTLARLRHLKIFMMGEQSDRKVAQIELKMLVEQECLTMYLKHWLNSQSAVMTHQRSELRSYYSQKSVLVCSSQGQGNWVWAKLLFTEKKKHSSNRKRTQHWPKQQALGIGIHCDIGWSQTVCIYLYV